jgi:hypothetical protein
MSTRAPPRRESQFVELVAQLIRTMPAHIAEENDGADGASRKPGLPGIGIG